MNLNKYKTIVFDCDGVILDSNKIKTEAFHKVAFKINENAADALVKYHVQNGGVSRYEKFDYFIEQLLPRYTKDLSYLKNTSLKEQLLKEFKDTVIEKLMHCKITEGLSDLRSVLKIAAWLVVSGGDQDELRYLFKEREIESFFNGGIFGSPREKHVILKSMVDDNKIDFPALYIGDSKLDHQVATKFGLDFIFISQWTELSNWEGYCKDNNIVSYPNVQNLIEVSDEI